MHIAIIGHISRDITTNGYTLGGAVSYAGITARRLGAEVTVLTRAHPKDAQHLKNEGINVINLPTDVYTTFRNDYHHGHRTQRLLAVAAPILASEAPAELYQADILLLAPVAQEVDPAIASQATHMLAASPQGWMREWDVQGRVSATPWYSSGRILPYLDAIFFSDADIAGDTSILSPIINTVPLSVITKAIKGCVLYHRGSLHIIPPRPVHKEVDATGAGDTFSAAFLVELHNGLRPDDAAYFANVTASMAIEGLGATTIPDREQVQSYIRAHPRL